MPKEPPVWFPVTWPDDPGIPTDLRGKASYVEYDAEKDTCYFVVGVGDGELKGKLREIFDQKYKEYQEKKKYKT